MKNETRIYHFWFILVHCACLTFFQIVIKVHLSCKNVFRTHFRVFLEKFYAFWTTNSLKNIEILVWDWNMIWRLFVTKLTLFLNFFIFLKCVGLVQLQCYFSNYFDLKHLNILIWVYWENTVEAFSKKFWWFIKHPKLF